MKANTENSNRQGEGATDIGEYIRTLGQRARQAGLHMACTDSGVKSRALLAMAVALNENRAALLEANAKDLEAARERQIDQPLMDRLVLDDKVVDHMIESLHQVDKLPDPVGEVTNLHFRPSGIQVGRMRVPLGVIAMIYESRPNVTIEAASLCLKSGNACLLRGGSEAIHSNLAIAKCIQAGLRAAELPSAAVQLIETTDRAAVGTLLQMSDLVDVIIPRGGKGLIERISRESSIPVIKHLDGVCHLYIDTGADHEMAISLALNAKASKYAVCCALETLLIAESEAPALLPRLAQVYREQGIELRGCERSLALVKDMLPASEADWFAEYLAPILAVRVVDDIEQAITHINYYGSKHTDAICTQDYARQRRFVAAVDSASVMVNASTQFADGFEYGLGAEIGISTDKLHARGPVGLEGLTTQKFVVYGEGHVRNR